MASKMGFEKVPNSDQELNQWQQRELWRGPRCDPGAASHSTRAYTMAMGCVDKDGQNVFPESDPIGCTGQATQKTSPERDPI